MSTTLLKEIKKSPNDQKLYRAIQLENGLRAVLISDLKSGENEETLDAFETNCEMNGNDSEDASTDDGEMETEEESDEDSIEDKPKKVIKLSAAALCVNIGSFCDPVIMPGMAHFLEHMVFMGSEKYPEENEFDAFLQKNGGCSNAFTDSEKTLFYFDMTRKNLKEGLDRLAQFFTCPLMSNTSILKELEAIDSEFDISKNSDNCRKEQLLALTAKKNHPLGKFTWGNSESLRINPEKEGVNVYEELKKFYNRHYSSHYMTLAVQSKHSLDTLEQWVIESYGNIRNNGLPHPDCNGVEFQKPFDTPLFKSLFMAIPIKNLHQVDVTWAFKSYKSEYLTKPLEYISSLIGHEGKGSLLSYLKAKSWAMTLIAGTSSSGFDNNDFSTLFNVNIHLTELGLKHIDDVIYALFQYIAMLKKVGPNENFFEEIKTLADCDFKFIEETQPSDYVQTIAMNLNDYPVPEIIAGEHLFYEYDSKKIKDALNYLTPSNSLFFYATQNHAEMDVPETETWFGTRHGRKEMPKSWYEKLENCSMDPSLHLPLKNEYIPSEFSLKNVTGTEYPKLILENELACLYYKKDTKFNVPRCSAIFHISSPIVLKSAKNCAIFDIYLKVIEENLKEVVYHSHMAKLDYCMKHVDSGVEIQLYGFNHKLPKLVNAIVKGFSEFVIDDKLFTAVKDIVKRHYYNLSIKPDKLNNDIRLSVLTVPHWNKVERNDALDNIQINDIREFSQNFSKELFITGLVHGNMTEDDAIALYQILSDELKYGAVLDKKVKAMNLRTRSIKPGSCLISVDTFNKNDVITVLTNYYQHGPTNVRDALISQLLVHLMEEPIFNILRTQKQLGYSVYVSHKSTYGILGISVTVYSQANKFDDKTLDDCVEEFFTEFKSMLFGSKGEAMFEHQRDAMISWRECEDSNIAETSVYWWREILDRTNYFDRKKKEVELLKEINLNDVKECFTNELDVKNSQRKKLSIRVLGNGNISDNNVSLDDLDASKNQLMITCKNSTTYDNYQLVANDVDQFRNQFEIYPLSKIEY